MKYDKGLNDILNLDYKFTTKKCYPYDRSKNEYDYTAPYDPIAETNRCKD